MTYTPIFDNNYLAQNETILYEIDDVYYDFAFRSYDLFHNFDSSINKCRLITTNLRLIIVDTPSYNPSNRWISFNRIFGFSERPDFYNNSKWPYQASLILNPVNLLVLETNKDNMEQRGLELSKFLLNAFLLFGKN